ncbi:type IV secretion system protein [Dyella subtropica]|uniref:type IV secretion system protein n=1 Tax=Dyella subtropica TaxID=2992127 RepID=UPI00225B2173|nr:type IV secretion system protein [Dyella subtropica]
MESAYFALIYNYLTHKIEQFAVDGMNHATSWVTNFAFIMVTLWVFFRGYRLVTGQSQESMMTAVSHMIKIALIVTVAKTMSLGSIHLYDFLYKQLPQEINQIVTGSDASPKTQIDRNLLKVSLATSAIDAVQVPLGDTALADDKARASIMAQFGIAAPAMTAGTLLLMYQVGLALMVGLGPLFILSLMFEQTKDFFRRWITYGLGTMFSLAVLSGMVSIVLELTERVAGAIWATEAISKMTGIESQGFSTMAFQQGGVGLMMTMLLISTPAMAAAFFNGPLGSFMHFAAVNGGGSSSMPGPQGQPPGSYGGGYGPQANTYDGNTSRQNNSGGFHPGATAQRNYAQTTNPADKDVTKPYDGGARS